MSVEYAAMLLLAPPAGMAAWYLATRGRRGRRAAGLGAAVSAALIVVALAGVFLGETSALRVFLVDVSAGMPVPPERLLRRVRAAAAELKPTDRVAVVVFGRDARVLLPPTRTAELPARLPGVAGVDQDGTSIQAAVELALALFGADEDGDLVLVTDGRENSGDVAALAPRLAAAGRPVHSLTLPAPAEVDAWVEAVRAPAFVASGQPIDFEVLLGASSPVHGKLVLLLNRGELARPEPVDVLSRRMVLRRRVEVGKPGWYTITARLLCGDRISENNEAAAAVRVRGRLAVTYVSAPGGRALARALARSRSIALRRTTPRALAATNRSLVGSDVMVLDDVPAADLGRARMAWLARFVQEAGRGLVVFGGEHSFGPGGYAGTPLADLLPVDPDPERRAARPSSVVVVADRSGSMAERIGGRRKIEFVRQAVLRAAAEFGARRGNRPDELSVVAFNQAPEVLLERVRAGTPSGAAAVRAAVARLFPAGQTRIGPALDAARRILLRSGLRRHILLVSDGRGQDKLNGRELAAKLAAAKIVLSVLATAAERNPGLLALEAACRATRGRFVRLASIADLPAAMARETRNIAGSFVRRGEFVVSRGPGTVLRDVAAPGRVRGYVLTGSRPAAPPALVAGDDPLLAGWRRGLGRVAACTTSLDNWAPGWPAAAVERVVLWAGAAGRQAEITVRLEPDGAKIRIVAESVRPRDDAELVGRVFAPDGKAGKIRLRRVGRLRYEGMIPGGVKGTYVVRVSDTQETDVLGSGHVTVGYSAEWRPGADASAARRLSHLTSGRVLRRLGDLPPPKASAPGVGARRDVGWVLLLAAAGVFLVASLR